MEIIKKGFQKFCLSHSCESLPLSPPLGGLGGSSLTQHHLSTGNWQSLTCFATLFHQVKSSFGNVLG